MVILTHNSYGPEILYHTPHQVISTPYHRNADGILDAMAFFKSTDETKALAILNNRKINLLVICPGSSETSYYRSSNTGTTFYDRLLLSPPNWLRRVEITDKGAKEFLVFEADVK